MRSLRHNPIGAYEKALVAGSWDSIFEQVNQLSFDFLELSIDESPQRQERLKWTLRECDDFTRIRNSHGQRVPSICLSANRAFPLGAADEQTRRQGIEIVRQGIELADRLGVRTVQLAGYEHYYDEPHPLNGEYYLASLRECLKIAGRYNVMIAVETMDTRFMSSISRFLWSRSRLERSPWLGVYPDVGNLSAWNDNAVEELELGIIAGVVTGVHLKDTYPVSGDSPGQFRDVPFGQGCTDFAAFFRMLTQREYSGPFLIEMWNRDQQDNSALAAARSWLLEKMDEAAEATPQLPS
jgi:hexulose-6-phosphate isomerase